MVYGVCGCVVGLCYVFYFYMIVVDELWCVIVELVGYLLVLLVGERVGDVFNVFFLNGWIVDDDGMVYIYYVFSDMWMYVVVFMVDCLVDYCLYMFVDGLCFVVLVVVVNVLIDCNEVFLNG